MEKKEPKDWKSFDEQLALLKSRGLLVSDDKSALKYLRTLGYYRLSGYLYPFRQTSPENPKRKRDNFVTGSDFSDVQKLYMFDKKLRQLALDALERIEIALRVNLAYTLGKYNPTAYKDKQYFDVNFDHTGWLARHEQLIQRAKTNSPCIVHNVTTYRDLPIWVCCEAWDFGTMSILYKGLTEKDKNHIARIYFLNNGKLLESHLHSFNLIRNIAAHHGRLWNISMVKKASLKHLSDPQWKLLNVESVFIYFCLMKRMLDVICPNSSWGNRFLNLLDDFPVPKNNVISLQQMGVIIDPTEWTLWKK